MSEPKIERGVPLPGRHSNRNRWAHIFHKMRVLDSVLLPIDSHNAHSCAAQVFGTGNFTVRKVQGGTRIWRLK